MTGFEAVLFIAILVYGGGVVACWIMGALAWSMNRDEIRPSDREEARKGARLFVFAPVWPIMVLSPLKQLIHDALSTEGDKK